jgi:ABC-type transport system involved in cytochrome bd biosynthesis fused ATPase/permease subunit
MTSPELLGRLYVPVLAAIAVIGVVIIFIVGLIHLWPYALAGAAVLLVGLVIPIILGMANNSWRASVSFR